MITISPGHWKIGTGARGLIDEVTEARKVAKRVVEILWSAGVKTTYVEDNTSKTKQQNLMYLVKQHNLTNRQLDVSVHFNSSGGRQQKGIGTEVLYYDAKDLAAKVSKAISAASGLIDRGAKQRKELAFLAKTNKSAILLEICFVNSTVDTAIYNRDFEKICQAIAKELAAYIGKTLKTSTTVIVENQEETEMFKLNTTVKGDFAKLFKKAYEDGIFTTDHSSKINSYDDEKINNLYLSYQIRRELANK